jgi:hypothetical protein
MRLLAIFPGAGSVESDVHRVLDAMREPGPGREWFRASPTEVYSAIALTMSRKRTRPPSPERDVGGMARDLLTHLEQVRGPTIASRKAEIDSFASQLYGTAASDVIDRAGLERVRTTIGGRADRSNEYFYARPRISGGLLYMRIRAGDGGCNRKGRLIGNDSSDTDGGVTAEGPLEGAA